VVTVLTKRLGWSFPQVFLALAICTAAVAIYIFTMVPEFLMRFLVWLFIRLFYRIRLHGIEKHVPDEGPAVLVCNHVTLVDALLLSAAIPRPTRFVMHHRIFHMPVLRWIFRTARAIPIAGSKEDPAILQRAFDLIDAELADGNLVCVFPEGSLTTDGQIAQFRPGVERILARRPVPVVPLALKGMWTSRWSRRDRPQGSGLLARLRMPRRLRARVEIVAGPPVDGAIATAPALEAIVRELRGAAA
jgi:1-acyl-sn-glycerol-3-phosphate acyltransferase